jgi:hypothetical protein
VNNVTRIGGADYFRRLRTDPPSNAGGLAAHVAKGWMAAHRPFLTLALPEMRIASWRWVSEQLTGGDALTAGELRDRMADAAGPGTVGVLLDDLPDRLMPGGALRHAEEDVRDSDEGEEPRRLIALPALVVERPGRTDTPLLPWCRAPGPRTRMGGQAARADRDRTVARLAAELCDVMLRRARASRPANCGSIRKPGGRTTPPACATATGC